MRVAFVGKGGSGKTTISALLSLYLNEVINENILVIDADINVHLPELILGKKIDIKKYISGEENANKIKSYLIGDNKRIKSFAEFRKTTPPSRDSNLVEISKDNFLIKNFSESIGKINLIAVGTYQEEGIGKSCYHNNLSIFESILTHLDDKNGVLVSDMVAGTDAFASTLHNQFDIIVLVIEPTRRSIEIYDHYMGLSKSANIENDIFIVGNKINSKEDEEFLVSRIKKEQIIGFIKNSSYIRKHDKYGGKLDFEKLEEENKVIFESIFKLLKKNKKDPNFRLSKIVELHKKYISQNFIIKQFGDLTSQIDPDFKFK